MTRRKRKEHKVKRSMEAITQRPQVSAPPQKVMISAPVLPWRVVGAAVQGVSHARLDLPCQDAQGYHLLPDGTLLVALADGAGSARFSEQGADYAVGAALESLSAAFDGVEMGDPADWERRILDSFADARTAVLSLADLSEDAEITPRDFAATLTCVVASAGRLAVGQIGDGAVVAVDEAGHLFCVTRLQRGEYANETHFISEDDALDQVVIDVIEMDAAALAVMSDGLIRLALKMPGQQPHAPFFQPLFQFAGTVKEGEDAARKADEQLAEFLTSERVNARTDDDKSLVLAVRGSALPDLLSQEPEDLASRRFTREPVVSSLPQAATIGDETETPDEAADSAETAAPECGEESTLDQEKE